MTVLPLYLIAFTEGDAAGVGVYHAAADGLKHLTLELGGKSPNIIFADANIPNAVNGAVSGIFRYSSRTSDDARATPAYSRLHGDCT